jgi:hypothetical protein
MTFAVTPTRDHVCREKAAMSNGKILCFERYRAQKTEERAQRPNDRAALDSPLLRYDHRPRRALDARQVAHRQRMLAHGCKGQKSKVKSQR